MDRYFITTSDADVKLFVIWNPHGNWCRLEDVESMVAERDRLARRVIELQELVDDAAALLHCGSGDDQWLEDERVWQLCRQED